MNKILSSPIKQVQKKFAEREFRPSDVCSATVKLAKALKPLNAYITVTTDLAVKQSLEADKRYRNNEPLGHLDGIPIAVKDNFCIEGYPTTCASLMLANFIPAYDATVYRRLRQNGTVLIGKTNLDQFAMGVGTVDSHCGPTKNIWRSAFMTNYLNPRINDTDSNIKSNDWFISGGSSGGSAVAVASGTCFAAVGSDTGGSTRNPASYCGLVGLKPSYGLVSRHGLIPLVNSMDVPGLLTRNVDDVASILNAIAGPDDADSTTRDHTYVPIKLPQEIEVRGLRVGIPKEYRSPHMTDEVSSCWNKVSLLLEEAGAIIVPMSMPHTQWSTICYFVLNQCEIASNMARYDGIEFGLRANEDSSIQRLYEETRCLGFNDVVKSRILTGNYFLLAENYNDYFVKAMKMRRLINQDFQSAWESDIDVLLTPTTLSEAPCYEDFAKADSQTRCSVQDFCTQPANMSGIPAVNVPVDISRNGLPLSLQLMAPNFHEERLLTVAKWIEEAVQFPGLTLKDSSLFE